MARCRILNDWLAYDCIVHKLLQKIKRMLRIVSQLSLMIELLSDKLSYPIQLSRKKSQSMHKLTKNIHVTNISISEISAKPIQQSECMLNSLAIQLHLRFQPYVGLKGYKNIRILRMTKILQRRCRIYLSLKLLSRSQIKNILRSSF